MSLVWDAIKSNSCDKPFDIDFVLTNKCNCRCKQCDIWNYYLNHPEMIEKELGLDEIEKIFSSYREFKVIGITGGEPYLRDDLSSIIDIIVSTQPKIKKLFITSNGILTKRIVKTVKEILKNDMNCELNQLISLDGPKEIHNKIRGMDIYDYTTETLRELHPLTMKYSNFKIGTISVYGPFNYIQFDKVLDEIEFWHKELNGLSPGMCLWHQGTLYKNEEWDITDTYLYALPKYLPRIRKLLKSTGSVLGSGRSMWFDLIDYWTEKRHKQVIPCKAGRVRYVLYPYGEVHPCFIYNRPIGNLREYDYDFKRIFDDPKRRQIREEIKNEKCPICFVGCEYIPFMMANPHRALFKWMAKRLRLV